MADCTLPSAASSMESDYHAALASFNASPHFSSIPTPAITPSPSSRRTKSTRPSPKDRTLKREPATEQIVYPCNEPLPPELRQRLVEMELHPDDGVKNYSRAIPFRGQKEALSKSTGRSRFNVYEYCFTAPNVDGKPTKYWVMWDYFSGLVRVHDLFDCCKPGKTEPGHAVRDKINPGLFKISLNITGGNLHAQGYWLPFECAKALLSKFCWRIRYALTIIFGPDFPDMCLPEDHPGFGRYEISREIILRSERDLDNTRLVYQRRLHATPRSLPMASIGQSPVLDQRTPPNQLLSAFPQGTPVSGGPYGLPQEGRGYYDPVRNSVRGSYRESYGSGSNLFSSTSPSPHIDRSLSSTPCSDYSVYEPGDSNVYSVVRTRTQPPRTPLDPRITRSPRLPPIREPRSGPSEQVNLRPVGRRVEPEDVDMADAHDSKRRKASPPPPIMYRGQVIQQQVGLFDGPRGSSRSGFLPAPLIPFTRQGLQAELNKEQQAEPAEVQMLEAAGSLVSLQTNDMELQYGPKNKHKRHLSASF